MSDCFGSSYRRSSPHLLPALCLAGHEHAGVRRLNDTNVSLPSPCILEIRNQCVVVRRVRRNPTATPWPLKVPGASHLLMPGRGCSRVWQMSDRPIWLRCRDASARKNRSAMPRPHGYILPTGTAAKALARAGDCVWVRSRGFVARGAGVARSWVVFAARDRPCFQLVPCFECCWPLSSARPTL